MKTETLNSAELRTAGYKALAAALGPLGMARFLRQFEQGNGDYTRERREWLRDQSVQSVTARIRARKKAHACSARRGDGCGFDDVSLAKVSFLYQSA